MSEVDNDEVLQEREEDNLSNNSEEGSSSDEDADDEKIDSVKKQLESNPYSYDLHTELISLYRKAGELEALRAAREKMSKLFPLTPEIWLDWLTDEEKLAITDEEKENLITLFEKAVKDYTSVSLWLEYIPFSIGHIGKSWTTDGIEKVRNLFERAVIAVGIHVTQGTLVWEAYKEFEKAYLVVLKARAGESETDELKQQEERILGLWKRELSIPLMGMDRTHAEFREIYDDKQVSSVNHIYKKALQKLQKLKAYEDILLHSEAPHYEEYKKYIEYELKEGDPIRIQQIYERAVVDNCLKEELWQHYTKYLDKKLKMGDLSVAVHERAVRNCPWAVSLWVNYGRALERYQQAHDRAIHTFETALNSGLSKEDDFKELWMAYIDYLRRRIKSTEDDFDEITGVFERASEQMRLYFKDTESEYAILKYWASFEARYRKNMERARELWEEAIGQGHCEQAHMWLDYANFERMHGHLTHYKKVLLRALPVISDWHQLIVNQLITYERELGTLESLEKMLDKCEVQMQRINEKRMKKMEELAKEDKRGRYGRMYHPKSKMGRQEPVQMDSEGFKIPPPPRREGKNEPPKTPEQNKRPPPEEEETPPAKKPKVEPVHGESIQHDPLKDNRTAFLSNLSYETEEDSIRDFFCEVGPIEEIRLVKDFKGRSKGYCYVVYQQEADAKKALEKDRALLQGRPVLVSPCIDKKKNPNTQPKFKFGTGLEKNKLFVKGLPFSTTKEELQEMFQKYGSVKDVRLVTYRNGHSKGLAYVEFEDKACASMAVVGLDGSQVMDHVISVAISNPPPRKPKKGVSESLGGGTPIKGPRGRGRTQVSLLPRSVLRTKSSAVQNGQKPLTNTDFANMLLNK